MMGRSKTTRHTHTHQPHTPMKMKTGERERRRYVRHHMHVPVELDTESGPIDTAATTLAVGGMFIQCEEPMVPGSRLKATLTLGEKQLTLPILVIHDGDYGMGVEFVDMAPVALKHLRRFFMDNNMDMLTSEQALPAAA